MRWLRFFWLLTVLLLVFALHAAAQVQVLTEMYDNARTGQNLQEMGLTPQNVNSTNFGKLFSWSVDGDVYAQPLYLPGVQVPGKGIHNLVFIATEHDSIYAFDADATIGSAPVWHVSFLNTAQNITAVGAGQIGCDDMIPEIGITGTPVIDAAHGTIYLMTVTSENGVIVNRLHALDVATGAEKPGSPVRIQASVPGSGAGSSGGFVSFNPAVERQRSALLLLNGVLYINWASYCDHGSYHGWVLSYDAQTLSQLSAFCSTPNGSQGGIWLSGMGPSADTTDIYETTGNGTFDADTGGTDWGDSVLRLNSNLQVHDSFTPFNQATLTSTDQDLGSSAPVLLPDQPGPHPHLAVIAGKAGTIYLLNRDNLGEYNSSSNQIVQEVAGAIHGTWGGPAYWNGMIYFVAKDDHLKAFPLQNGQIAPGSVTQSSTVFGYPGSLPAISANGGQNGIVWVNQVDHFPTASSSGGPAVLHAYDATDVAHELYNSSQAGNRDQMGIAVKFAVPTIANGRVYVGTRKEVDVFGLLSAPPPTPDFTLALSPASSTVAPNTPASLTLNTTALNGDTSALTLSCTAPASGCIFSPTSLAPGQSASVTVAATALATGPNTITVSASDGTNTHTASASITVSAGTGLPLPIVSALTSSGFTLSWTTSQPLNTQVWYGPSQPSTHVYNWVLTTQHSLTLTGLNPNTTYQVMTESSYFTNPDLTSPVFTVTTLATTAPPDFSVALAPASSTITPNTPASLTLTTTAINGDTSLLTLSCTAPASGCIFSPTSLAPGQSASVTVAATALATGPNTITVSASDGTNTHTASASVTVINTPPPDFSVALSPVTSTIAPNIPAALTLISIALNGDTSSLTLTCTAPATGCSVSPASLTPDQSATVSIAAPALANGANPVTVSASDGNNTHTVSAVVTVSGSPAGLPLPTVTQLTSTSVTLSWTTSQPLNTQVWYGTNQPSTHAYNWVLTTQHALTLTGLSPNTTYFVQTESSYFTNPDLTSNVFTLTTAP